MTTLHVTVDMGKKCAECGGGGAVESGICLACTLRAMRGENMRSATGRAVQKRNREIFKREAKP